MRQLKYKLDYETGVFDDSHKADDENLADTILVVNVSFNCGPENKDIRVAYKSIDGRKSGVEMSDDEVFRTWLMLGQNLAKSGKLSKSQRAIADMPYNTFVEMIKKAVKAKDKSKLLEQ